MNRPLTSLGWDVSAVMREEYERLLIQCFHKGLLTSLVCSCCDGIAALSWNHCRLFRFCFCSNEYYSKMIKNAGAIGHLPEFGWAVGHLAVPAAMG